MSKLKKPRRIMMLVKAGSAVDGFVEKLVRLSSNEYGYQLCGMCYLVSSSLLLFEPLGLAVVLVNSLAFQDIYGVHTLEHIF